MTTSKRKQPREITMEALNQPVSRYSIVLIENGKSMQDLDAEFKDFNFPIYDHKVDSVVRSLEAKHNMRCCVLVNEG